MILDARPDRYYYIYDSRERRALVLDRATGEEWANGTSPRAQLIEYVQRQCSALVLRRFARWCAREVDADTCSPHTAAARLWAAAQRDNASTWRRVRGETTDTVMLAMSLGLPSRDPEAARLLTLQACTHPNAQQAARDAAHMSERWAEFSAEPPPAVAAPAMRTRQVDWLLDRLPAA